MIVFRIAATMLLPPHFSFSLHLFPLVKLQSYSLVMPASTKVSCIPSAYSEARQFECYALK